VEYERQGGRGYVVLDQRTCLRSSNNSELCLARSNNPSDSFAVQFSLPEVSHVECFVGRDEELDRIHQELQYNGSRRTAVVHGLGGMGKTQLVLAYAQRHRDEYLAVFWINSKDVDTVKQGYAAAARRIFREHPSLVHLKTVAEGGNLDDAVEAVKQWLSRPQNSRWLVIYDNYDTPKLPGHNEPGTFDIRPFLPEAHHETVLITTRSSQLRLGPLIAVKKLQSIEHNLEILSHASGRDKLSNGRRASPLVLCCSYQCCIKMTMIACWSGNWTGCRSLLLQPAPTCTRCRRALPTILCCTTRPGFGCSRRRHSCSRTKTGRCIRRETSRSITSSSKAYLHSSSSSCGRTWTTKTCGSSFCKSAGKMAQSGSRS
jgi:hypothetical protein